MLADAEADDDDNDEGKAEDSSDESEDEDDIGALISEKEKRKIMQTVQAIRAKDPKVYDKSVKFFGSRSCCACSGECNFRAHSLADLRHIRL